jgi:hypothetical protein
MKIDKLESFLAALIVLTVLIVLIVFAALIVFAVLIVFAALIALDAVEIVAVAAAVDNFRISDLKRKAPAEMQGFFSLKIRHKRQITVHRLIVK